MRPATCTVARASGTPLPFSARSLRPAAVCYPSARRLVPLLPGGTLQSLAPRSRTIAQGSKSPNLDDPELNFYAHELFSKTYAQCSLEERRKCSAKKATTARWSGHEAKKKLSGPNELKRELAQREFQKEFEDLTPEQLRRVNSIYANMVRWKDHVRKPTAEEDAMVQAIAMEEYNMRFEDLQPDQQKRIFGLKGNAVRWANTPRKPQPKDDQMLQGLAQEVYGKRYEELTFQEKLSVAGKKSQLKATAMQMGIPYETMHKPRPKATQQQGAQGAAGAAAANGPAGAAANAPAGGQQAGQAKGQVLGPGAAGAGGGARAPATGTPAAAAAAAAAAGPRAAAGGAMAKVQGQLAAAGTGQGQGSQGTLSPGRGTVAQRTAGAGVPAGAAVAGAPPPPAARVTPTAPTATTTPTAPRPSGGAAAPGGARSVAQGLQEQQNDEEYEEYEDNEEHEGQAQAAAGGGGGQGGAGVLGGRSGGQDGTPPAPPPDQGTIRARSQGAPQGAVKPWVHTNTKAAGTRGVTPVAGRGDGGAGVGAEGVTPSTRQPRAALSAPPPATGRRKGAGRPAAH